MKRGIWKPRGFGQALDESGLKPEEVAVKLQELGWATTVHSVLDWKSDRSQGPKHLVQAYVLREMLKCDLGLLIKVGRKKGAKRS